MIQATDNIQDTEAERAILGKLLEENKVLSDVATLKPEDFFLEAHQHIFRAILEMDSFDVITVSDKLKAHGKLEEVGGALYIAEIEANAPIQGNFEMYANIIKDHSILRKLIAGFKNLDADCRNPGKSVQDILIKAEKLTAELSEQSIVKSSVTVKESVCEYVKDLEERAESKSNIVGISTGIFKLDQITSGLTGPDLIVIAAASGIGKTTLAMDMVVEAAKVGRVQVFSREMGHTQLTGRFLSSMGNINNRALKTGNLDQEQWEKLSSAAGNLSELPILIDDRTSHIDEAVHKTKQEYNKNGLALAVFDYIQIFKSIGQTREREVAHISSSLKNLAMDLNIPVIALSQLNKKVDERTDHTPQLSDVRESGAIEHDSDIVILIARPDKYENNPKHYTGIADIITAKNRNGPPGTIQAGFEGKFTKFYNIA